MKKIVQEKIIKIIQPEIIEYYCDKPDCGHRLDFNHRKSVYRRFNKGKTKEFHFCKQENCEVVINDL